MKTKVIAELDSRMKDEQGNLFITFKTDNAWYKNWLYELDKRTYSVIIDEPKRDRTTDQNSLLWALIEDICKCENAQTTDKWEMYCYLLRLSKAKYTYISIVKEGLEDFKNAHGIRAVEVVGNEKRNNGKEFVNCCVFLGSSQMTTKEMGVLIDCTIDYANKLGIDTTYYKEMVL